MTAPAGTPGFSTHVPISSPRVPKSAIIAAGNDRKWDMLDGTEGRA